MAAVWTELDRALEAATRKMWAELADRGIPFHSFGICIPDEGVCPFVHTRATLGQVIADRCGPDTEVTTERLLEFAVDPAFWWDAAAEFEPLFAPAARPAWEDSETVWLTGHHERGASAYRWRWQG